MLRSLITALAIGLVVHGTADAQFRDLGKRISKRAEDRAKARAESAAARAEDKAARATDKALDAAESAADKTVSTADKVTDKTLGVANRVVTCVLRDGPCIRRAKASGAPVAVTDDQGNPVSTADSARAITRATARQNAARAAEVAPRSSASAAVSEATPADSQPQRESSAPTSEPASTPEPPPTQTATAAAPAATTAADPAPAPAAEQTLFAENFSSAELGDFPRTLQFISGVAEVAEWEGGRYLKTGSGVEFAIPLPQALPQRFVIEMEIYHGARRHSWGDVMIHFDPGRSPGVPHVEVNWSRGGVAGGGIHAVNSIGLEKFQDALVPVRIVVDGDYAKVNLGDARVANVPSVKFPRNKKIWVKVPATDASPAYVGAIRVVALPPQS